MPTVSPIPLKALTTQIPPHNHYLETGIKMAQKHSNHALIMPVAILAMLISTVSGQITTSCTNSLISSFTPCFNFLTGSMNGIGGSPTSECCEALGSLVSSSADCACLILTGNVPISLPINRTLAISLPRACKGKSVPLQCKATASPLPSPGPVTYAPGLPPLPPFTATGSGSASPAMAPPVTDRDSPSPIAESPVNQGMINQGQRPLVLPSSAVKLSLVFSPSVLLLLVLGITMLLGKKI